MPQRSRIVLACALALVMVLGVVAFVLSRPHADLNRVYRIGIDNTPPYQFFGPDGSADGFAVQTLTEAARRSGLGLQWIAAPEGPEPAFKDGKLDLWPRLRDTAERRRTLHITAPWIRQTFCLLSGVSASGKT